MHEQWEMHIHRKVNDAIYALPPELASAIRNIIWKLQQNPYLEGHRLIGSFSDVYELFVNNHRIVYQVKEEQRRVKVARVHLASRSE